MTSSRTGRGEQPPLFPFDVNRSLRRRREAATGGHPQEAGARLCQATHGGSGLADPGTEEDVMERDRTRRPLFELDEVPQAAKIKVIGLGGGGSNAVSRMMAAEFTGVEFIVANTDVQALHASPAPVKLQLGAKLTQGLGAGSNPDIGRQAAQEDPDQITRLLHAVQGISDLILVPGLVNLDFADVRTIMSGMGMAMMGTGTGRGEHRALDAAQKAVASPLLDDTSIQGARGILINFTGGADLSIHEVEEAARIVQEAAHEDANIIFGAVIDP